MVSYNWDKEFTKAHTFLEQHNILTHSIAFSAIRSCIEADEPKLLAELLGDSKNAHIYALMMCFTAIPATKCIEYLVSNGTPLNESFCHNPFKCTPQELLDTAFSTTKKEFSKARGQIYKAIQNGRILAKNNDHTVVFIDTKKDSSYSYERIGINDTTQQEEKPLVFKMANALTGTFRFIVK